MAAVSQQPLTRGSKRRVWVIAVIALLAIVVILAGIKAAQIGKMINAGKSFAMPPESVTTARVEAAEWQASRAAVGTAVAIRNVTVASEVAGMVREIGFDSGAFVRKGEVLVKLDSSAEEAQLAAAKAEADLARAQLHRQRSLREAGVRSRRHRPVVDQAAAVVILQSALDAERASGRMPGSLVEPGKAPEGPSPAPD